MADNGECSLQSHLYLVAAQRAWDRGETDEGVMYTRSRKVKMIAKLAAISAVITTIICKLSELYNRTETKTNKRA